MGGITTTLFQRPRDPNFNQTTLLLSGNFPTNGAQNNTFLDSSSNNFTITRNPTTGPNAPTQGTFTPFSAQQGAWSNYFDGTDDYLAVADNAVLRPGTSNFTLEAWIYRGASNAAHTIYAKGGASTGIVFQVTSTNVLRFTHTTTNIDSAGTIAANTWTHVAVVREGTSTNQTKLYINGTQDGQGTVSTDFTQTEEVRIGTDRSAAADFNGYISNLRFTKGAALYTGNFTPATSELTTTSQGASSADVELLTCQSNRFIDNSSNAFTITTNGTPSVQPFTPFAPSGAYTTTAVGGSGYFDGTGDDLVTPSTNGPIQFGTDAFTIEFWLYPRNVTTRQTIVATTAGAGTGPIFALSGGSPGGGIGCGIYGSADTINTGNGAVVANQWQHIALVRNSTATNNSFIYVNGVLKATGTISTNFSTAYNACIGSVGTGIEYFTGYISNLRIVKGTAVYTGAFTPPIAPVTTSGSASSYPSTTNVNTTFSSNNTSVLLNFTNAGIVDSTAKNNLETVGNAQISTTQSRFGGTSMFFNGSANTYLRANYSQFLNFGTGSFTVELWFYQTASAGFQTLIGQRLNVNYCPFLIVVNGGTLQLYMSSDNANWNLANAMSLGAVSLNTWYHVALVRDGSTIKAYVNGTQAGTTVTSSASLNNSAVGLGIGGNDLFSGYIDDVRITNGVARYTANFNVPTIGFTDR